MYIYNVKESDLYQNLDQSKNFDTKHLGKYWWLIEILKNKSDTLSNLIEQLENIVNNDFKNNMQSFDFINRFVDRNYFKFLGEGVDGLAFQIDKDKVLKLFQNKVAFDKTNLAIKRLHNNGIYAQTELMIYDAGKFIDSSPDIKNRLYTPSSIYWCIMKKVDTKSKNNIDISKNKTIINLLHIVYTYLERLPKLKQYEIQKGKTKKDKKTIINSIYRDLLSKINTEFVNSNEREINELMQDFSLQKDFINHLIKEVVIKYLTGRRDLHSGNIGVTNQGYLVFFDSAYGFEEMNDEDLLIESSFIKYLINKYS